MEANFRSVSYHGPQVGHIAVEGVYEPLGRIWVLRHWRLWTDGSGWGDWHRVHGNKRKDVGSLKLVRDTPPALAPMPEPATV